MGIKTSLTSFFPNRMDSRKENSLREYSVTVDGSSVIEWIQENCAPDEVFSEEQLIEWAENNGFVKKDSD